MQRCRWWNPSHRRQQVAVVFTNPHRPLENHNKLTMQRSRWMILNGNSGSGLRCGLSNGCRRALQVAVVSCYPYKGLQCFSLCSSSFSLSPTLPSLSVFRSLSLSLSLCLRNIPAHVTARLIKAFAIKNLKLPCHVSIVKNESKNFVRISFS